MDSLSSYLAGLHYIGLFLLLILGGVGLPFPEDATLILAGVLLAAGEVDMAPALATVYAGVLLADFVLYSLGKKYGRYIVTRKRFHRLLPPHRLEVLEGKFKRHEVALILLGRHVMGLRAQLLLVAGVMRMNAVKFVVVDGVSAMFTIALMVSIGYYGGRSIPVIRQHVRHIELVVGIILGVVIAGLIIYKYLRHRREKRITG